MRIDAFLPLIVPYRILSFISLLFLITSATLLLAEPSALSVEARQAPRIPVQIGDHCIVCGTPLTEEDVVLQLRGRRVPLNKNWLEEFVNNPEQYFYKLQPKGALFTEPARHSAMRWAWFALGLIVLVLLANGGLAASMALRRGLSPGPWFVKGVSGNIFAILQISRQAEIDPTSAECFTKIPSTSAPLACTTCGHENHPLADRCNGCNAALNPQRISEARMVSVQ